MCNEKEEMGWQEAMMNFECLIDEGGQPEGAAGI
jgi:hypothetical protein